MSKIDSYTYPMLNSMQVSGKLNHDYPLNLESGKCYISKKELQKIFLKLVTPDDINKLRLFFKSELNTDFISDKDVTIKCLDLIASMPSTHDSNYRDLFMERAILDDCHTAIVFLVERFFHVREIDFTKEHLKITKNLWLNKDSLSKQETDFVRHLWSNRNQILKISKRQNDRLSELVGTVKII